MNHFCTYCDSGYAARLLCLHDSLAAGGDPFQLHVLCFDREVERVIRAVARPSLVAIPLEMLLAAEPEFAAVRSRRSPVEFYFTATPVLVRHCLQLVPSAEWMSYVDADIFFFAPAAEMLARQHGASVGIVPHRFPPRLAARRQYGTYNVSWVSFARDANGLACLDWWRARCLEWCFDRVEDGRFADQGYLDEFPGRFAGVRVLDSPGINAAPWNLDDVHVGSENERVRINGEPLLYFHFHAVRESLPGWFDPGFDAYETTFTSDIRDLIYRPYLQRLLLHQESLWHAQGIVPRIHHERANASGSWRDRWQRLKGRWLRPQYRRLRGKLVDARSAT